MLKAYNFDGVDIDLETAPAKSQNNLNLMKTILPQIYNAWKAKGRKFYITMAPEFPDLRTGNSIYPDLIKDLKNYYSWIQPQIYNQSGDGIRVTPTDQKQFTGIPSFLAQNNSKFHTQFLYLVMKYMTSEAFNNFNVSIPANKLLIGLPATPDATIDGYTSPQGIKAAYQLFKQYNLPVKGLMTWATPYDAINNQWGFAKSYQETWGA